MSVDDFANPASATGIKWADYSGRLMLIEPNGYETGIATSLGDKDAVRADVTILDGPEAGEDHKDVLVFPRVLQGQLKPSIGRKVLGRLGQGSAKPGQNAPWKLADPTEQDKKVARNHLASKNEAPF